MKRVDSLPEAIKDIRQSIDAGMENLGEQAVEDLEKGFANGTDALGRPWAPLSPRTIRETGPQILVDDGDLRDSFSTESQGHGHVRIKTTDTKFPYHEFGVPSRNLPARPMLQPLGIHIENNLVKDAFEKTLAED